VIGAAQDVPRSAMDCRVRVLPACGYAPVVRVNDARKKRHHDDWDPPIEP
jgi:hypothetical protein